MKRILNLNDFSGPALKGILFGGFVLPALMFLISRELALTWLERAAWAFLEAGGILLVLFFALVALEQIQDGLLYRRYLHEREKHPLVEGECQFCGNRRLQPFARLCPVCGAQVHPASETITQIPTGRNKL